MQAIAVWSHPEDRGGWESHKADTTHEYPRDAKETAQTIYRFMGDFLTRHSQFATRPPADWQALELRVSDFADRVTRDAKFEWFMSEDKRYQTDPNEGLPYDSYQTYPCFLKKTSLKKRTRGGDYPRTRCADPDAVELRDPEVISPPPPVPLRNEPDSPWVFTADLLDTWLVRQDLPRVVDEMTVTPSIARAFSPAPAMTDRRVVELLLRMWLVDDHGVVNEFGHGSELRDLESALSGPSVAAPLTSVRYGALAEVASHPYSPLPFELIRNDFPAETPDGEPTMIESYVVVFTLRHAPRDLMLLTNERVSGEWLTSFAWATQ